MTVIATGTLPTGLVVPPLGIFGVHDQDKDDAPVSDEGEMPFLLLCL